jgi:hypothetical protein
LILWIPKGSLWGGMIVGPRYGLRKKAEKKENKRRSENYMKGTLAEIGSKWLKKKNRRSEVKEKNL